MSNPWDRRDAESSRAFHCFTIFLNLGADRSLVGAYRQETGRKAAGSVSGNWGLWASKFEWQQRATAWDSQQQQATDDRRAGLDQVDEKKWAERRRKIREREFTTSEQLLTKARAILGNKYVRGTILDAAQLLKLAFELQRRATEMEKHEQEHVAPMRFELVLK